MEVDVVPSHRKLILPSYLLSFSFAREPETTLVSWSPPDISKNKLTLRELSVNFEKIRPAPAPFKVKLRNLACDFSPRGEQTELLLEPNYDLGWLVEFLSHFIILGHWPGN